MAEDQLSLAIGKKGQNVRLAARLSGWNIDILTPAEYEQQRSKALEQLATLHAVGPDMAQDLLAAGYISLADVAEVGAETLARITGADVDQARQMMAEAGARMAELEAAAEASRAAAAAEEAAGVAAQVADETTEPPPPDPGDLTDAEHDRTEEAPGDIAATDTSDSDDNESPKP